MTFYFQLTHVVKHLSAVLVKDVTSYQRKNQRQRSPYAGASAQLGYTVGD